MGVLGNNLVARYYFNLLSHSISTLLLAVGESPQLYRSRRRYYFILIYIFTPFIFLNFQPLSPAVNSIEEDGCDKSCDL